MTEQPPISAFPVSHQGPGSQVFFDRSELNRILGVYGRMVAAGEWKDYAIDMMANEAVFSIFRRSSEMPIYRIIKTPREARNQGAYRVLGMNGTILKRGRDLSQVLRLFERKLMKIIED
ncbi:MAG: DUF2794 domain-containing protein [Alphaproteobacteria bacterium]|nr:MAG: DUF2794 domain-containing protein [Alphaproteobacteria bacterium]